MRWCSSDWWNPTDTWAFQLRAFISSEGLGSTKPLTHLSRPCLRELSCAHAALWLLGLCPRSGYQVITLSSDSSDTYRANCNYSIARSDLLIIDDSFYLFLTFSRSSFKYSFDIYNSGCVSAVLCIVHIDGPGEIKNFNFCRIRIFSVFSVIINLHCTLLSKGWENWICYFHICAIFLSISLGFY